MLMLHIILQLKSTHYKFSRPVNNPTGVIENCKMENQTEAPENISHNFDAYQKLMPDVGQAYGALSLEGIRQS